LSSCNHDEHLRICHDDDNNDECKNDDRCEIEEEDEYHYSFAS